jgi:D-alanine-D-alanine ligase
MSLPKKIAVLMGGPGSERDVSLATARGVSKALRSLGAEVVDVDVRDEKFPLPPDVDLAFLTIHGTFGEDGSIQKILEDRGVAYTGDGVEESRLTFDKIRSKEKFRAHGGRPHAGVGGHSTRAASNYCVADRGEAAA